MRSESLRAWASLWICDRLYAEQGWASGAHGGLGRLVTAADNELGLRQRLCAVGTAAEFADCLRQLMQLRNRTTQCVSQRSRRGTSPISKTTAWNLIDGKTVTDKALRGFLHGCGVPPQEQGPWLAKRRDLYPGRTPRPPDRPPIMWIMSEQAREHFILRAHGHRSGLAEPDLFRGRENALARVSAWVSAARSPGRPLVVTGEPGSGKSALLSRVILGLEAEGVLRGAAVHARDLTAAALRTALAPLAGRREVHSATDLLQALNGGGAPVIVAVDALDEAATNADRRAIADLLAGLARLPRLRVVVATRELAGSWERYAPGTLLYNLAVSAAGQDNLIDLDADAYADPAGLRAFAAAVLTQDLPGGAWTAYRADPGLTGRLAAAIADRARHNYLVAALTATDLGWRHQTTDPADPDFDPAVIPSTVGEAITKYLDTLPNPQRSMSRDLLTVLAYARGDGIDERRWVEFAVALGYQVGRTDVQDLRQSPASAYLVHSQTGEGASVTRLFHQALADELRRQQDDPRRDEHDLLSTLLAGPGREWAQADAYRRRHTADHAEAAGLLPMLLADPRFLAVADLDRLLPLLPADPPADVAPVAAVLRQATDARWRSPQRRLGLLALSAAHLGVSQLQDVMTAAAADAFRVGWAHALGSPHQVIGGHSGEGVMVAIGRFEGRTVIVSGDSDGTVFVTDAVNGCQFETLPGHPGGVNAVAIGQLNGRDVVVTAGADGQVRLADTLTSSHVIISGEGPANALALGRIGEHDVLVVGLGDGVLVHDPASGRSLFKVPYELPPFGTVAVGRIGTRDVIACAADDGFVVLLDGHDGNLIEELAGDVEDGAHGIWFARVDGRDTVVTSGLGPVLVHDAATGQRIRELDRYAMATCVATLGDRIFVASADTDGRIDLRDIKSGKVARSFFGHTDAVRSLAVGSVAGRDVIVSGSTDAMVRIHDLGATPAPGISLIGHHTKVEAMAVSLIGGRLSVVSAGNGVRIFDADTGRQIGPPLAGVKSDMHLTAGRVADRDVIICGGFNGYLQIFDAVTREAIADWSNPEWFCVRALTLGTVDGRDVLVVGINDNTLPVLDARTGHRICRIRSSARQVAIGQADGHSYVAVIDDDFTGRVFDATTGAQLSELSEEAGPLWDVATGSLHGLDVLVTGGHDGAVRLVDPLTGTVVDQVTEHDGDVISVATSRIGHDLAVISGGRDAAVQITTSSDDVFVIDVVDVVNAVAAWDDGRVFVASGVSIFSLLPTHRPPE